MVQKPKEKIMLDSERDGTYFGWWNVPAMLDWIDKKFSNLVFNCKLNFFELLVIAQACFFGHYISVALLVLVSSHFFVEFDASIRDI